MLYVSSLSPTPTKFGIPETPKWSSGAVKQSGKSSRELAWHYCNCAHVLGTNYGNCNFRVEYVFFTE